MTQRPIGKLDVSASIRQVDAKEACGARYLGAMVFAGGIGWAVLLGFRDRSQQPVVIVLLALVIFATLLLFQPWHRRMNLDLDHRSLRLDWRVLGVFPFLSRRLDLAGQRLGVGETMVKVDAGSGSSGAGCLALALPFPFSLLGYLAAGGRAENARFESRPTLAVRDEQTGEVMHLALLRRPDVADAFLAAARELMPDRVDPVEPW